MAPRSASIHAARVRLAREALPDRKRKLPWERAGLSRVARVLAFLEFLPITKGPLAGHKMKLLREQREFVEEVYGNLDHAGLRLITCGGPYDTSVHHYTDNIVVYAHLVSSHSV